MQQIQRGQAAGELPMDVDRLGVDDVADAHHRGRRECALVHCAQNHAVIMAINQSRRDVLAAAVDDEGRTVQIGA